MFKKIYGMGYITYMKKMSFKEGKKKMKEYSLKDANKILEKSELKKIPFFDALKNVIKICKKKKIPFNIKIFENKVEEIQINEKKVILRQYSLQGRTLDEKKGVYRIRPPEGKDYNYLIVALTQKNKIDYFVIPKSVADLKKSINLPLWIRRKAKYSIYKENWNQIASKQK